jgi:hypothetical protein
MFIQSAELTAAPGKSGELGPMVTKMRDLLSSETGKQWWSWAVLAGRPFGTQLLSTRADGVADMVAHDPARLRGMASVPMQHPDAAVAELDRFRQHHIRLSIDYISVPSGEQTQVGTGGSDFVGLLRDARTDTLRRRLP